MIESDLRQNNFAKDPHHQRCTCTFIILPLTLMSICTGHSQITWIHRPRVGEAVGGGTTALSLLRQNQAIRSGNRNTKTNELGIKPQPNMILASQQSHHTPISSLIVRSDPESRSRDCGRQLDGMHTRDPSHNALHCHSRIPFHVVWKTNFRAGQKYHQALPCSQALKAGRRWHFRPQATLDLNCRTFPRGL